MAPTQVTATAGGRAGAARLGGARAGVGPEEASVGGAGAGSGSARDAPRVPLPGGERGLHGLDGDPRQRGVRRQPGRVHGDGARRRDGVHVRAARGERRRRGRYGAGRGRDDGDGAGDRGAGRGDLDAGRALPRGRRHPDRGDVRPAGGGRGRPGVRAERGRRAGGDVPLGRRHGRAGVRLHGAPGGPRRRRHLDRGPRPRRQSDVPPRRRRPHPQRGRSGRRPFPSMGLARSAATR